MTFSRARFTALLIMILAALLPVRLAADPADIAAASRSVVRVVLIADSGEAVSLYGHGTGFAVGPELVVTNAHVIADMADNPTLRMLVIPAQGVRGYLAKVAAFSPRNDLALLRVPGAGLPPATLSPATVPDGQQVFAVGYPGNVDLAQGLDEVDLITPTPPVKVAGTISAGRSSRSFDTLLHTAPLATGNSGGPLMDGCGRVIGVNSFGTISDGSESDFFFAVSMREVLPFLRGAGVSARSNALPCLSMADFDKAEAARQAGQQAQSEAVARVAAEKLEGARDRAERRAQLEVFAARENYLALAGLALLIALGAGGGAWHFGQQGKARERKQAGVASAVAVVGALAALIMRPAIESIDERAAQLLAQAQPSPAASPSPEALAAGAMRCVIDPQRSRVTVSDTADVPIDWRADGCMNGRSQYGLDAGGWTRILVPGSDQTVAVTRFDPASRTYAVERYLLDFDAMGRLREARGGITPPSCGANETAARKLGDDQARLKAMLPAQPNERLVYNCTPSAKP